MEVLLRGEAMSRPHPSRIKTPFGAVAITWSERGIRAIEFVDDPPTSDELSRNSPNPRRQDKPSPMIPGLDPETPLDLHGTPWQLRVWAALREIPPGQTVTYGELARRLGQPGASRAVGAACAANPIAILVPCHRVVPTGGGLGGYYWGVERKRRLLEFERQNANGESVPRETTKKTVSN